MPSGASQRHRPGSSAGLSRCSRCHLIFSLSEGGEPFSKGELFFWLEGGAFFGGEGVFLIFSDTGVFLGGDFEEILSSGTFFGEGDFAFFFVVGGSPLLGGNRAFMAEPSDRPAINDRLGEREKWGCEYETREKNHKKVERKNLALFFYPTRSGIFSPAGRSHSMR